ncbi:MAG: GNAT family N-acetyltransferase [Clostridia bacterium]|nr:GNAT family N-acetyltransferase [Clostridia bacterium]
MKVRMASRSDAAELLGIYKWFIDNTAATFEYTAPTAEAFGERIDNVLKNYPYLVAISEGRIVGYAYAARFNERAAASVSAELSVYVAHDFRGNGTGSLLYREIERILVMQNVYTVYADITCGNENSIRFHEKCGYKKAGHLHNCGYKMGQWLDLVLMEKQLKEPAVTPERFVPITELSECLDL